VSYTCDAGSGSLPCPSQSAVWALSPSGVSGAQVYAGGVGGLTGSGGLPTQAYAGPGAAGSITGNTSSSFSLANGAVHFQTLLAVYSQGVFGLANGADQSNSIGFVVSGSNLTCQSVSGGTATTVSITSTLSNTSYYQYQIVATSTGARFYLNGALVATITTNIPSTSLHALSSTSSDLTALPRAF
jgi:hypothetical protein